MHLPHHSKAGWIYITTDLSAFIRHYLYLLTIVTRENKWDYKSQHADLALGTYLAQLYFSTSNYQNSGSTSFYILPPADLLLTNLTVAPINVTQGSGISLVQDVSNIGGLSSTNTTLNMDISGPNNFYDSIHQKLGAIGAGNEQAV